MPYIDPASRARLQAIVDACAQTLPPEVTAGELNYLFTRLALEFVRRRGLSYQTLNDVRGALHNCASEFYRRVAAPYEDMKIRTNGDVFDTPV
jgi:Domain of unknown function (DUF6899)